MARKKDAMMPPTPDASEVITTTLYDIVEALQDTVEPDDDATIIAIVAHWIHEGRLHFQNPDTVQPAYGVLSQAARLCSC